MEVGANQLIPMLLPTLVNAIHRNAIVEKSKDSTSNQDEAKNTLLKRAVTNTTSDLLADDFTGTTAIVMAYNDPVSPAKALAKFADGHAKFKIRCAALEGDKLTIDDLIALSKLPTKEVLLGQFLSVLNGVPTGLVQVLSAVPRTFLYGLQAIKEQKEQSEN